MRSNQTDAIQQDTASEHPEMPRKEERHGIRDWKGLLHDRTLRPKVQIFAALSLISTCMTLTQMSFIDMGMNGRSVGYALGLLIPVAVTALLLGKAAGALQGLVSGSILYVHAHVHPLTLFERYFVSPFNSIVLYAIAGLLLGLFFAIALRNRPQGIRRVIYLGLSCLAVALIIRVLFTVNAVYHMAIFLERAYGKTRELNGLPLESQALLLGLANMRWQTLADTLFMLCAVLATDRFVHQYEKHETSISVRTAFGTQLLAVVALVFSVVQAICFVVITRQSIITTWNHMGDELYYLDKQLSIRLNHQRELTDVMTENNLPDDVREQLLATSAIDDIMQGYDLADGTVLIVSDGIVTYSYNPAYPVGKPVDDLFFTLDATTFDELAQGDGYSAIVYDTRPYESTSSTKDGGVYRSTAELGYLRVIESCGDYLVMATPSSMVFANRRSTMAWVSFLAFVLLTAVYIIVFRLLHSDVIRPIDRTNASLAKICEGDLDVVVNEVRNVEFASLSRGINVTVGSLKDAIAIEAARFDQDLKTAKAIQESALPRVFPPFPEISAFDLYASMDAAKEVGGDFYDFFLIDDRTLCFLIADVSGKGIPGALFMMAAKTEIENYLATGMEPAQAIASANKCLCKNNDAGMFVTLWAATLDWETGLLTYVNAGHNYPLLRRGRGGSWEWLTERCGLFLGTFEMAKYRQETIELKPGDELLLYTDGVNEAFNLSQEEYGNDRLEAFLADHDNLHAQELVGRLREDVRRWANGAEQSDDVTILALEFGVAPDVTDSILVPATLDNLRVVNEFVMDELDRRLCPVDVQHKIAVALEELFVNVCSYAYADQSEPGEAEVSYAYGTDPSSLTVEIRDWGIPFDPTKRENPQKPFASIHDVAIGGLGIYMVKRTMDDFVYLREGNANVTAFKKRW